MKKKTTISNLDDLILQDKLKDISDAEIGKKYGVSFKYIEKVIRNYNGVALSKLVHKKKIKKFIPENFEEEKNHCLEF